MLCDRLQALKAKKNLSVKKIAELSGVPESTVSRILSGQTADPGFEAVKAIVIAMDGSLDELAGIAKPEVSAVDALQEQLVKSEERERRAERKQYVLFAVVIVLFAILLYITIDALHGGWGLFRYQEIMGGMRGANAAYLPSAAGAGQVLL